MSDVLTSSWFEQVRLSLYETMGSLGGCQIEDSDINPENPPYVPPFEKHSRQAKVCKLMKLN